MSRPRGPIPRGWSSDLACVIGLIATDGNLSPDGRHLLVRSKDRDIHWLLDIGLTTAKSLTLRPPAAPDEYFADFFRGCIDGDGSVLVYTNRYHVPKCERYVYERLYLSIVSASHLFIEWLRMSVTRLTGVTGSIAVRQKPGRHPSGN